MRYFLLGFWCVFGVSFCVVTLYIGVILYREDKLKNGEVERRRIRR
jgi:hypothetical protein